MGRILDEVADEPGSLPLLEFCLTRLYETRQDGCMRQASYEAIGRVAGAIVRRADAVLAKIEAGDSGRGDLARDIFLQLVQLGEGTEDTRRRMYLDDLGGDSIRPIVNELADARLVVTGRDAGSGKDMVEVAHEALIRRWPRLRGWLRQDRADLYLRREIERAASSWDAHGEAPFYRWSDERVMEATPAIRRMAPRFPPSPLERRFLGPLELEEMLALLQDLSTTHAERARIGDRLALLPGGDPRRGVGLREDGLPDILWRAIPGGEVELEIENKGRSKFFGVFGKSRRFVAEPFHMAQYPVTVAQWRLFLTAKDGYDRLIRPKFNVNPARQRGRDNQPAVDLAWVEATAYCRWLSVRLGFTVRLPAEWEWQQAATGGDPANQYPWGSEWADDRANTVESELGRMVAVGLYSSGASAQGVLDLAGNAWEWCLNQYDHPKETGTSGEAPRVVRGGSWLYLREIARCAFRDGYHPVNRNGYLGFRVVCVSPIA